MNDIARPLDSAVQCETAGEFFLLSSPALFMNFHSRNAVAPGTVMSPPPSPPFMESLLLLPFCPLSFCKAKFPSQKCGHKLVRGHCLRHQTLLIILNETLSVAAGVEMDRWFQVRVGLYISLPFCLPRLSCPSRGKNESV